jgi:putative heme iron utilization protein
MPSKAELAADARTLVRRALKASLATIAAGSGYPYASLITVATEATGADLSHFGACPTHQNPAQDPAPRSVRRHRRRRRSAEAR